VDEKTLDMVVRQVIEALKAKGLVVPAAAPNPEKGTGSAGRLAVPVPFSAGAEDGKKGDRHRFQTAKSEPVPFFREHTAGGNEVLVNPGKKAAKAAPQPPARIFVTAELLAQRAAASTGGTIGLAANEFLTPAAEDLAEIKHWTVQKTEPEKGTGSAGRLAVPVPFSTDAEDAEKRGQTPISNSRNRSQSPFFREIPNPSLLGLVVAAPSDKVENLLAAMRIDGLSVQSFNQTECWMRNLESLCDALAGGEVKAAVLLAPYAADAMVLAGKCKGVLPVQGTRADSVAAAVRHFGANLLMLEYAVSTYHEMRQMVRVFAASRPEPTNAPLVERLARREGRS
jgi:hypothetical protein